TEVPGQASPASKAGSHALERSQPRSSPMFGHRRPSAEGATQSCATLVAMDSRALRCSLLLLGSVASAGGCRAPVPTPQPPPEGEPIAPAGEVGGPGGEAASPDPSGAAAAEASGSSEHAGGKAPATCATKSWVRNTEPDFTLVGDKMKEAMRETGTLGAAMAIAVDGKIVWVEGFGWADRARRVRANAHTP